MYIKPAVNFLKDYTCKHNNISAPIIFQLKYASLVFIPSALADPDLSNRALSSKNSLMTIDMINTIYLCMPDHLSILDSLL